MKFRLHKWFEYYTLTYQKYSYQSTICATNGGNMLQTLCVVYKTNLKCIIFQLCLIACYTRCLGSSLVDIFIVACIVLSCATCGTGGTNFQVTVS